MAEFVTYPHAVIADGVFYPTGANVPVKTPAKAAAEKAAGGKQDDADGKKVEQKAPDQTEGAVDTTADGKTTDDTKTEADKAEQTPAKAAEKAATKSANKGKGRKAKAAD